jgi:excinuclease UvrABC nuclease subunit
MLSKEVTMSLSEQDPRWFSEAGISSIKAGQTGVYGIYNSSEWIYIGQAEDLRDRLLEHVRGKSDQSSCMLKHNPTSWVGQIVDKSQLDSLESSLIAEYSPACNKTA